MLGLASISFAFADSVVVLDSARFIQGVGGACMWAAGMAWLMSAAPVERRGELIGAALSAAIVGVLLGPVLGGAATCSVRELVFSAVAVVAAGLAGWAWTMPGVEPEREPRHRRDAARARPARPCSSGSGCSRSRRSSAAWSRCSCRSGSTTSARAGATIGLVFLVSAAVEAVVSPIAGRFSDRAGRLAPIRVGLIGAVVMAVLLPLPQTAVLVGLLRDAHVRGARRASGRRGWRCSPTPPRTPGLDQALAFAISNLAWALGHVFGAGVGGALADATTDTVPYAVLAVLCATTLVGLTLSRRRQEALST